MQVIEINDKNSLNDFIVRQDLKGGQFLQSWEWGEFQKSLGRKIFRLGAIGENGEILASALIIRHPLPLGKSYLYCPRGPAIISDQRSAISDHEVWKALIGKIEEIAKKENAIFFRFEPPVQLSTCLPDKQDLNFSRRSGTPPRRWQLSTANPVQPKDTLILDIGKPEEEILAGMHPKTRYNIRLAEKRGVKIRIVDEESRAITCSVKAVAGRAQIKDTEEFLNLLHQTSGRDRFRLHPDDYYQKLISFFSASLQAECFMKVYFAEWQNKLLAANLAVYFGDTATYLHGASGNDHRNIMAPHLLHWRIIQDARKAGYKYYDWWGIVPGIKDEKQKIKNWEGITRFKKGFGGEEISYPGAFDLAFQKYWYKLYEIIKKARKQ